MCPDSDTLNLGVAGASSYWSYHNFKKCVIDLNYHIENAVMTFTDSQRLPITNPDLAGTAWKNVFRVDKSPLPIQDEINLQAHSPSKSFWDSVLAGLYSQERPTVEDTPSQISFQCGTCFLRTTTQIVIWLI